MNFSYTGTQFPFQWPNSTPYMTSGYNGGQHVPTGP